MVKPVSAISGYTLAIPELLYRYNDDGRTQPQFFKRYVQAREHQAGQDHTQPRLVPQPSPRNSTRHLTVLVVLSYALNNCGFFSFFFTAVNKRGGGNFTVRFI